jgi:hypothetical protein
MPHSRSIESMTAARPQSEIQLKSIGALIADRALNPLFLLRGERAATAGPATAPARLDATHPVLLEAIDNQARRSITQAKIASDPTTVHAAFVGANNLTTAFVLCLRR